MYSYLKFSLATLFAVAFCFAGAAPIVLSDATDFHILRADSSVGATLSGTVDVTIPGKGTLTQVPWNTTAASLQVKIDAISPQYKPMAVAYGGPWPLVPITVRMLTDDRMIVPKFLFQNSTISGALLSDVSKPAESATLLNLPFRRYGREVENFSSLPEKTFGLGTFITAGPVNWDGNASNYQVASDATGATIMEKKFPVPVDLRGVEYMVLECYNPMAFALYGTVSLSNSWGTQLGTARDTWYVGIPTGWSSILLDTTDLAAVRSQLNWSNIAGVSLRIESYNNSTTTKYSTNPATALYTDGAYVLAKTRAKVVLTYDDGFQSIYTKAWPIMQQYPTLKHSLFVVKNWTQAGYRIGLDTAPTASVAQLKTMWNSGLVQVANHSDAHWKYESGVNPNNLAAFAEEQAIQWTPTQTPGTFTLTIPGRGTTIPLANNATCWQVEAALRQVVGSDLLEVTGSYLSNTLGVNGALRVSFENPLPIMIPDTPKIRCGSAFSIDEISAAYKNNADWLVQNGMVGSQNIVAYPEGNCGYRVWTALRKLGIRTGRYYANVGTSPLAWMVSINNFQMYQLPAFHFGGNYSACIAMIERAIRTGSVIHIMFHDVSDYPSIPGRANTTEYKNLLEYLQMRNGTELDVVSVKDLADQAAL